MGELATINNYMANRQNTISPEEMAEQMEGLSITYPRIKIPSGGMLQFEVPNPDDPEKPQYLSELTGVIVDHFPSNAYWLEDEDAPKCSSVDGKYGVGSPGGECSKCRLNEFGSGEGGSGKACKNMHRVYILRPGEIVPVLLTLPATSIKPFGDFLALSLLTRGVHPSTVETRIKLQKASSKDGKNTYSKAAFSVAEKYQGEAAEDLREYAASIKAQIRATLQQRQVVETYEAEIDDDELPFN